MEQLFFHKIHDDQWDIAKLVEFIKRNEKGFELVTKYSYIGSTQSNLDVMQDHLQMSFCVEKILQYAELLNFEKRTKFRSGINFKIVPKNTIHLARVLHELCVLEADERDPDEVDILNILEEVNEYEKTLETRSFKFPDPVDDYYANLINAGIFELASIYDPSEDDDLDDDEKKELELSGEESDDLYLQKRYAENREWQWGIWKSAAGNTINEPFYVSSYCWVIPSTSNGTKILHDYSGFKREIIFEDAILLDEPARKIALNVFGAIQVDNLRSFSAVAQCIEVHLSKELNLPLTNKVNLASAKYHISEYCDVLKIVVDTFSIVYFDFNKIAHEELKETWARLNPVFESLQKLLGINENISCDWTALDDEKFEELCYDLLSIMPRFDSARMRKMGKSRSRDGGRDIVAFTNNIWGRDTEKFIFQCKLVKSGQSLTKAKVPEAANVIMEHQAKGYGIFTSTVIDTTLYDMLDGFSRNGINTDQVFSIYELERLLARNAGLRKKYFGK